jgi:hypothetical protein
MKRFLLPLFSLVIITWSATASHIVGGEMSYVCLGNNDYQINLKVYRDCYNGLALFDNPTYISIFDGVGNVYTTIPIYFPGSDTLSIGSNCGSLPGNLCIEEATFTTTVNLPPTAGGYKLEYQRCCRSLIIQNIEDPTSTGITVVATIPDTAIADCNSSPVFNIPPPTAFCAYFPISYDQSATDPDGDSLVYELCSATNGADDITPYPIPALPYSDATYTVPLSGTYPFFSDPALSIDPSTGLITGTITSIGIFDLTVCVKEYRNGSLIATHQRDMGQVVTFDGGPATAVETMDNSSGISVYPNPASDIVAVSIQGNENPFEVMNIYDVLGKVVYTEKLAHTTNNFYVNTSGFSQGIFRVQLVGENISATKSLIIQK